MKHVFTVLYKSTSCTGGLWLETFVFAKEEDALAFVADHAVAYERTGARRWTDKASGSFYEVERQEVR